MWGPYSKEFKVESDKIHANSMIVFYKGLSPVIYKSTQSRVG